MAEPNLSPSLNTFKREVGTYLGWGRDYASWTTDQNTDFTYIMDRALRTFYFPPIAPDVPRHEWEFLRTTNTVTLVNGTSKYDLPDNFGGAFIDNSISFASGTENRTLKKMPEEELRQCQSVENSTGTPFYFAVRPKSFDASVGQRWEIEFYPTPGLAVNSAVVTYRYAQVPDRLGGSNIYPLGGGQYGEALLYSFLAAAESMLDDQQNGAYQQKFQNALATAIRIDSEQKTTSPNVEK
jgi:hypothetical protein